MPALPAPPSTTPGTQNLSVAQFGNLTVNPGSYSSLTVNQCATVTFTGGVYHFHSWSINQYAKLYFAASSEIRVAPAPTAASDDPSAAEVTESPAVETPVGEEQEESDEDENFPPVDPPVEEEPLPSTWTHALFLPLVTATAEGTGSVERMEAEVIEEPAPVSDSSVRSMTSVEAVAPDRVTANQIFLPVVTR